MWKDWLERTLTRNKAPVMLASEIVCAEPANNNVFGPWLPAAAAVARGEPENEREPAEAQ